MTSSIVEQIGGAWHVASGALSAYFAYEDLPIRFGIWCFTSSAAHFYLCLTQEASSKMLNA